MAGTPKWSLSEEVAANTQGMVVSGFPRLNVGIALFLGLPDGAGGAWLDALMTAFPATPATETANVDRAVTFAFTWTGLVRMNLAEGALASFSTPFREGMFQEDRLRRLGDRRKNEWLDTTGGTAPRWSGNTPLRERHAAGAFGVENEADQETFVGTEFSVHAMILLYTADDSNTPDNPILTESVEKIETPLKIHNVSIVHKLPLVLDPEKGKGFSREHFGFADGLSQPKPYDAGNAVLVNGKPLTAPPPTPDGKGTVQHTPLGEFLIGYDNCHQEPAPGPVVLDQAKGDAAGLPAHPQALGFHDLGLNGSYLVVRELFQDVPAFWSAMDAAAEQIAATNPGASIATAEGVAEKVVGRTMDGHILRPDGTDVGPKPDTPINDFRFFEKDRHGRGCPLGSHVRRSNPRDSLAPNEDQQEALLNAANFHRILRRGRKYGPKIAERMTPDHKDRGLLFMCLNTDIARQFEFIQHTWLLNSDFHTLFEEVDPLIGPDGDMTIPQKGLRVRAHVKTFVHMRGGEYFFLPSIPALRYLSKL